MCVAQLSVISWSHSRNRAKWLFLRLHGNNPIKCAQTLTSSPLQPSYHRQCWKSHRLSYWLSISMDADITPSLLRSSAIHARLSSYFECQSETNRRRASVCFTARSSSWAKQHNPRNKWKRCFSSDEDVPTRAFLAEWTQTVIPVTLRGRNCGPHCKKHPASAVFRPERSTQSPVERSDISCSGGKVSPG